MTKAAALLLATMMLLAGCGRVAQSRDVAGSEGESRDSVVAVVERLSRAAIAKDVEAFMALWEHSDSVVYSRHGRTFVGWEEIRVEHERAFSAMGSLSAETGAVYARGLGPNAGVGTSFTRLSTPQESNWFITTFTVRASEGAWQIVQGHASYPPSGVTPLGEPER